CWLGSGSEPARRRTKFCERTLEYSSSPTALTQKLATTRAFSLRAQEFASCFSKTSTIKHSLENSAPGTCHPVSVFFSQKQFQTSVGSLSSTDLVCSRPRGSGLRRVAGLSSKKAETDVVYYGGPLLTSNCAPDRLRRLSVDADECPSHVF